MEKDAAKWFAGYKGEQSIDYPLTFLPSNKFYIRHGLRLFDGSHYFQIDTLILSWDFFLILEVKISPEH
ncbi:nuclease-related domain-containing protein [Alteribacillus bidgolensis]|uniref:nuclease-related domain-containing protein n=1 Tax=Alteribacillus bidgolensis TaxID=930129 RepID=UPI00349E68C0